MRLHKWINRVLPKPRTIRRQRHVFGDLGMLEDRLVPTTFTWTGNGTDDLWSKQVREALPNSRNSSYILTIIRAVT
jgi:hypothetical protein